MEADLAHAEELYAADKLFQSARLIESVEAAADAVLADPRAAGDLQSVAQRVKARLHSPELRQIRAESEEADELRRELHSEERWTLSYDGADTKVWYREEGSSAHSFRVEVCCDLRFCDEHCRYEHRFSVC